MENVLSNDVLLTAGTLQVLQDVSQDYARKTATVETFPHASTMAVGIHPCRHADVMKKFIQMYATGTGQEFVVDR